MPAELRFVLSSAVGLILLLLCFFLGLKLCLYKLIPGLDVFSNDIRTEKAVVPFGKLEYR